jgi:hypothetical protein
VYDITNEWVSTGSRGQDELLLGRLFASIGRGSGEICVVRFGSERAYIYKKKAIGIPSSPPKDPELQSSSRMKKNAML